VQILVMERGDSQGFEQIKLFPMVFLTKPSERSQRTAAPLYSGPMVLKMREISSVSILIPNDTLLWMIEDNHYLNFC
jgi:hypothetical protein